MACSSPSGERVGARRGRRVIAAKAMGDAFLPTPRRLPLTGAAYSFSSPTFAFRGACGYPRRGRSTLKRYSWTAAAAQGHRSDSKSGDTAKRLERDRRSDRVAFNLCSSTVPHRRTRDDRLPLNAPNYEGQRPRACIFSTSPTSRATNTLTGSCSPRPSEWPGRRSSQAWPSGCSITSWDVAGLTSTCCAS